MVILVTLVELALLTKVKAPPIGISVVLGSTVALCVPYEPTVSTVVEEE